MKKGDVVTWTSQAAGSVTKKTGEIVAVVPARVDPRAFLKALPSATQMFDGLPRYIESYLVMTSETTRRGEVRRRLYWPRVSGLVLVEDPK